MLPVITIVGRPNVGKSTLFNCLTQSRDALVADMPGVTRDRLYGTGKLGERPYLVVDTGGLMGDTQNLDELMSKQVWSAVEEADAVLFLVDARAGISGADEVVAEKLRRCDKKVWVVVNKTDGIDPTIAVSDFYRFGLGAPLAISAAHTSGVQGMINTILSALPVEAEEEVAAGESGIKVAIVGRPNVGKSTLVNRILGEDRVIVFDAPGTTRDSIFIPMERHGERYTLIDTAGVRRRRSIHEIVEKFSVIKTLNAVVAADVVVLLIDACENVIEQDLHLLGHVQNAGRAMVIAVNKWDGLSHEHKEYVKKELDRRLSFLDYVRIHFISALHGSGVGDLFHSIKEAYQSANCQATSAQLTNILIKAVDKHQLPLVKGRRIKLRYAHLGGHKPLKIIIHGNQCELVPETYKRYLASQFRRALKLMGSPIELVLKTGKNPYSPD